MDNDVAAQVELEPPGSRVVRPPDEAAQRALERQRRAEAARIAALVQSMLHGRAGPTDEAGGRAAGWPGAR